MAKRKTRLDDYLVATGAFPDHDSALRAIIAHEVKVDDRYATSAAAPVGEQSRVEVKGRKTYVSRGGLKLERALTAFCQNVEGMRCIDVGSSTGGFADCLLQHGAGSVTCVDVNYGQLAWSIRSDSRVAVFERTNIKTASPDELGAPFDLIVCDVSFIGLASLAPVFARLCHAAEPAAGAGAQSAAPNAGDAADAGNVAPAAGRTVFIGLVKPQFESRPGETDHGVVTDEAVRQRTVSEVSEALAAQGFEVTGVVKSPITGPEGNVEYLVRAEYCV